MSTTEACSCWTAASRAESLSRPARHHPRRGGLATRLSNESVPARREGPRVKAHLKAKDQDQSIQPAAIPPGAGAAGTKPRLQLRSAVAWRMKAKRAHLETLDLLRVHHESLSQGERRAGALPAHERSQSEMTARDLVSCARDVLQLGLVAVTLGELGYTHTTACQHTFTFSLTLVDRPESSSDSSSSFIRRHPRPYNSAEIYPDQASPYSCYHTSSTR